MPPLGKLGVLLLLIVAVGVWAGILVLLMEMTRQLLDVLRFIVELGGVS
jgi:hypothetical protein